jgi:hypothetical protein
MQEEIKARLHPHWVGGEAGYVYSVICNGELLVAHVRNPECDAARALVAQGISGKLILCDGKTGKPRVFIDIEKAAKLTIEEAAGAPRFRKYRERDGSEGHSPAKAGIGKEAA